MLREITKGQLLAYHLGKAKDKGEATPEMISLGKMNNVDMKIKYYDIMLKFLEEIIRNISGRTYQIKNAIEWNKFQAGYN